MLCKDRANLFFCDLLNPLESGRITRDKNRGRGLGKKIGNLSYRSIYDSWE